MAGEAARLFELKDGRSDKFWEISLDGTAHTVRYGRVGTDGQSKTKEFDTEDKARASYEKLIGQKTGKGYSEVTSGGDSRQQQAKAAQAQAKEREPFVKAILDSPDDPAAYLIYADWLEDQGDPLGEFVRIQWQLEDDSLKAAERKKLATREKKLLKQNEPAWLGDLAEDLMEQKGPADLLWGDRKFYKWEMGRGFLDGLHIEYLLPDFAKTLKKSPLAATLRKLTIRDPSSAYSLEDTEEYGDQEWSYGDAPSLKILAGTKFENLRHFEVSEDMGLNCHCQASSVHKAIKLMPRLESLQLDAHSVDAGAVFRLKLPELRSLTLQHSYARYPLEVLAKNKSMSSLESLCIVPHALRPEDDGAYIDFKGFKALCRSTNLPALKNLSLDMSDVGDNGLAELVKSSLFAQLKTLKLDYGIITDSGVETLCAHDLSHLESLHLGGNYISRAGIRQLRNVFPKAKADGQYTGEPTDEYEYLWNGDIE